MELSSPFLPEDLPWLEIAIAIVGVVLACIVVRSTILGEDEEAPVDYAVPLPEQCKPGWSGTILENPSIKIPRSSAIQCYNPATGQLLGQVNPATPDGIDRAVARAADAQKEWATTTFRQRRKVLGTMLKFILDNQEDIATVACLDSGKTKVDAMLGEILVTIEKLKWTIQHGEKALRPERRPTNFLMMYKHNEVRWEPLGVLAACVSWNYPFHNALSPIISTLFTGSAILVKSSEQTAFSANYFTSIARNALSACGHSANLVQSLVCWPQTANHLTSHPRISHITFIGSRPVAHIVCASAANALIPVCVELGGKDPAVVLDSVSDYDLEHKVVPILMKGIFTSSGQNCIGIERIIACPRSYDRLIPLLERQIRSLRQGSSIPTQTQEATHNNNTTSNIDIGAMISATSFPHITSLIQSALSQGAALLAGTGKPHIHPSHPHGHYFSPTFLSAITPSMPIATTELFAPICLLLRAASPSHAIEIANSTPYALGASVFGNASSNKKNVDMCVQNIKAGMVSVNDFGAYYAVGLPFGGRGGSGYGRFGGQEGLRGICNLKSVCKDSGWAEWVGVGTRIPGLLDYVHGREVEGGRKVRFLRGMMQLGYADGVRRRVRGLWEMVRSA
ncbi:MAG: hypothetical protein L6R38_005247 [Xanthoria sp. 2 TBL-2021]|nr:MAG: hypothetical protein L6R38_005247 [Xanthoria sp. 2 TBL-2021]